MRPWPTARLLAGLLLLLVVGGGAVAYVTGRADSSRPARARVAAVGAAPAPGPSARPTPPASVSSRRCFGAPAADPAHPCSDPALRTQVVPRPDDAEAAQRNEPCRRRVPDHGLRVCFWGTPLARARRTVALIGDSHASHWRAAMQTVVRARRWRAISISRAGCPLTLAEPVLPSRARIAGCLRWNRAVQGWVRRHPRVSVLFTGAHRGSVVPADGRDMGTTRRLGYAKAWRRILRAGVRQIVVFRDTPRVSGAELRCVERAAIARRDAGTRCAQPRRYALPPDPETQAARAEHSPRIQVADLSRLFCGPQRCAPVIGGALVLRDVSHMTTTFSATLGPYLLRTIDGLAASWR